jgi:hypothetical protein
MKLLPYFEFAGNLLVMALAAAVAIPALIIGFLFNIFKYAFK